MRCFSTYPLFLTMHFPCMKNDQKIIVLTAPSGSGKTTIARRVLAAFPNMRFSVSATTRPPRPHETDGVDYHFVSEETFKRYISEGKLLEYEKFYGGLYYGTLISELENASAEAPVMLDIEVKGAINVKKYFGEAALVVFIRPPSLDALKERLSHRATETPESLRYRLERAVLEMDFADRFDAVVVNENLETAVAETLALVSAFLATAKV